MGRDISLIVFDEAHHARSNNPYNRIMQEFYFDLPHTGTNSYGIVRPAILGLTASPILGGNAEKELRYVAKFRSAFLI
jgi:ERCC4-related helicase